MALDPYAREPIDSESSRNGQTRNACIAFGVCVTNKLKKNTLAID